MLGKTAKECRFCANLKSEVWEKREYFRCQAGRYDNKYGTQSFIWQGIWRPKRTVKAAQNDCPYFQVHPQVKLITRKGRP